MLTLTVLFVCGCWLVSEMKMWRLRSVLTTDDFGLTEAERRSLQKIQRKWILARSNVAKSERKVAALEQMGLKLRRNKDGSFDGRNRLGKKLNKDLPRAQMTLFRYNNQATTAEEEATQLENIPKSRPMTWIGSEASRLSNRLAILGFSPALMFLVFKSTIPSDELYIIIIGWAVFLWTSKQFYKKSLATRLGI